MAKKEIDVWKINDPEMPPEVREKVLEKYYDINVDYQEWWDGCLSILEEDLKEVGVELSSDKNESKIYFSTDRDWYAYAPNASIVDDKKFLRAAIKKGYKLTKADIREALTDGLGIHDTGGRTPRNLVRINWDDHEDLTEFLNDFFNDFLHSVNKEYDYLTEEEQIVDTLEANEYEFGTDGRIS